MTHPDTTLEQSINSLFSDHDLSTGIYGEHEGFLQSCATCKQTLLSLFEKYGLEVIKTGNVHLSNADGDSIIFAADIAQKIKDSQTERLKRIVGKSDE